MKRTGIVAALSIVALVLAGSSVFAQEMQEVAKIPPPVRAAVQTKFMTEKLSLSPEQKTQVEAINLKYAEKMQPVLDGSAGGMFARMREGKALDEAKDAELQKVLNPEQYQGYLGAKDEMKQKMLAKVKEKAAGAQ